MEYKSFPELLIGYSQPNVLCLLKIGQKEHLEQLAAGKLRFRNFSYYSSIESQGKAFFDPHEGIESVLQADRITLEFKQQNLPLFTLSQENGLTGQVLIKRKKDYPIFCFHAIHTGEWTHRTFTEKELPEFKAYLDVPNSMRAFGDWVWIIRDWEQFTKRIKKATRKKNLYLNGNLVKYISFLELHGDINHEHKFLVKNKIYEAEREYRFRLESDKTLPDPFILDVGDLSDITMLMTFDEMKEGFYLDFKN